MKNKYLLFIICLISFACSSDKNEPQPQEIQITCSPQQIEAAATESTHLLKITCSSKEWTAYATDECATWIKTKITDTSAEQGIVSVTILENTDQSIRNGNIVIKSGTTRIQIPVKQQAPMQVSQEEIYSLSTGGTFTIDVITTSQWNAQTDANWINVAKISNNSLSIITLANSNLHNRTATLTIMAGEEKREIIVLQESAENKDITVPEGYQLVWHDEFNQGDTPGSDWTHEVQGPGWVNNELQTYVNGEVEGKRVTELIDGKLNIHCFKGSGDNIYSARLYAKVSQGWLYGYFESRIMLPKGKGTWPAFWMMPVNNDFGSNPWPNCGEIDIMEEVGADPNIVSSSIHCEAYNHTIGTQKTASKDIGNAESEFHIYACEWTPDFIRFFVDGQELLTFHNEGTGKDKWPFTYAFYPILNLAWGGSWGGYKGVDESALPVTMRVDYVRIFQKNNNN